VEILTEPFLERSGNMGLFDQVLGAFGGGSAETQGSGPLAVVQMLASHEGGIAGLLQKFQANGLGDTAQSWISNGENQPVSGDMIHQVLGSDIVRQIAEKTGLPLDQASNLIAEHLPQVVDGLTPNGQVEPGESSIIAAGEAMLKTRFGIG
jgi:uncharacterized protein YidB (DUF937 family)